MMKSTMDMDAAERAEAIVNILNSGAALPRYRKKGASKYQRCHRCNKEFLRKNQARVAYCSDHCHIESRVDHYREVQGGRISKEDLRKHVGLGVKLKRHLVLHYGSAQQWERLNDVPLASISHVSIPEVGNHTHYSRLVHYAQMAGVEVD